MTPADLGLVLDGDPDEAPNRRALVDLDELTGSHLGIIANSGGGKSGALRRLLERTHGQVLQIVLDPEDEFYTLRERSEYVIAGGAGGDAPATVAGAAGLARLTLEHGFSLIVQLNDLGEDAADFVTAFLGGLMAAPADLWRPVLIVLDEAQRFCSRDNGAATPAVRDLLFRGRKRGFTACLASLRMAEIDPGIRGMVNNWMLGRVGQALDRRTMAEQLGFSSRDDRLRHMAKRTFWTVGPALSAEPQLIEIGDVATTIVGRGAAKPPTPPAPDALRQVLASLAAAAPTPPAAAATYPDDKVPQGPAAAYAKGGDVARMLIERDEEIARLGKELTQRDTRIATLELFSNRALPFVSRIAIDAERLLRVVGERSDDANMHSSDANMHPGDADSHDEPADRPDAIAAEAGAGELSPEDWTAAASADLPPRRIRILGAIAWSAAYLKRSSVPRTIAAWLAETTAASSTFERDLSAMRTGGLIDYPAAGEVALTESGRALAPRLAQPRTRDALWKVIAAKLPPRRVAIVQALWLGQERSREDVAFDCDTTSSSSTFERDLSALRTLGLLDYPRPKALILGELLR